MKLDDRTREEDIIYALRTNLFKLTEFWRTLDIGELTEIAENVVRHEESFF